MNAKEARRITDQNTKLEFTHNIFDVYILIENEAKKGHPFVEFQGNISEIECFTLKEMGYNVFWFHKLGQGLTYNISWGCYQDSTTEK